MTIILLSLSLTLLPFPCSNIFISRTSSSNHLLIQHKSLFFYSDSFDTHNANLIISPQFQCFQFRITINFYKLSIAKCMCCGLEDCGNSTILCYLCCGFMEKGSKDLGKKKAWNLHSFIYIIYTLVGILLLTCYYLDFNGFLIDTWSVSCYK